MTKKMMSTRHENAFTRSWTEDLHITSVAPYQLGHKSYCSQKFLKNNDIFQSLDFTTFSTAVSGVNIRCVTVKKYKWSNTNKKGLIVNSALFESQKSNVSVIMHVFKDLPII